MRALPLLLFLVVPQFSSAQDNNCREAGGQQVCDCASLAPDLRICGDGKNGWFNGPPPPFARAFLAGPEKSLTVVSDVSGSQNHLEQMKDDYIAKVGLSNVTDLSGPRVAGFEQLSFTGSLETNDGSISPMAVTYLDGPQGTFLFESLYRNLFRQIDGQTLSAEQSAAHISVFAQIEVENQ